LKNILFGILTAWLFIGCGQSDSLQNSRPSNIAEEKPLGAIRVQPPDLKQRQVSFLNKIRQADPQFKTIDKALLNERNELGLILDRGVEMNAIPALMKTILTQMAKEFPGQDLTVIAYTPSNPPQKIGIGHLNARTRDLTYTPATTR